MEGEDENEGLKTVSTSWKFCQESPRLCRRRYQSQLQVKVKAKSDNVGSNRYKVAIVRLERYSVPPG